MEKNMSLKGCCNGCKSELSEVFIKCHECIAVKLCLQCFASGVEFREHLKTHKYCLQDIGAYSVFDAKWSALEEKTLLESIEQYGFENWGNIAKNLPQKSPKEIENHYNKFYVETVIGKALIPQEIPNRMTDHTPPMHESILSVPPPVVMTASEDLMKIAYMPNRDDYEFEFDNDAEKVVCNLSDEADADETEKDLTSAIMDIYLDRLNERQRRKDICREYQLVDKFFAKNNADSEMKKHERELRKSLRQYSRFMKRDQFEAFIKNQLRERQLKKRISQLRHYRINGITKRSDCNSFEAASFRRNKRALNAANKKTDSTNSPSDADEADILNHRSDPHFNLLTSSEKQLCQSIKISPSKYINYKSTLIRENIAKRTDSRYKTKTSQQMSKSHRRVIMTFLKHQQWIL